MKSRLDLNSFIGNRRVVEILRRAIAQDRLPHAMIFAGPVGIGKCTLAVLIAQFLNCSSSQKEVACGQCSTCRRIMAVIESRYLECQSSNGDRSCGSCASCKLRAKRHPDIHLVEPERTTISIEQIRNLISEVAFQPVEARYRVVILDPAEQMRLEAHNSLLKTLEEPASRTIIILVTSNPYMLLETIRSRSRLLQFGTIPLKQIEQHLVVGQGRSPEEAHLAAVFSGGSLGVALTFNTQEYREIRKEAIHFVRLLLNQGSFAEASTLAANAAKEKVFFKIWIESAAVLLQDIYYAKVAPEHIMERDVKNELQEIARPVGRASIISAIDSIKKLRKSLQYNVNRQLALEALLFLY